MKKLNFLLLIIFTLIFLSGCEVSSNVVLDYRGKTTEKVSILNENKLFSSPTRSKKQVIESVLNNYSSVINYGNYNYSITQGKNKSGAVLSKEHDSICSYFKDSIFNQYVYKHVDCEENDFYIVIKNDTEYIPYCSNCSDWPSLNKVILKLTLPIKAEEHNADSVNGNTYVWKYDENTTNKDFYIKINKATLEENKKEVEEQNKNNNLKRKVLIIVLVIVAFAILAFGGMVLYKKYKSNKIEY